MFCWCQFYLFLFFYPPFLLKSSSHRGLILFSLSFGQGSQNSVFSHSCIRPRPVPMWSLMTLWIPAHLFMVYITLSPFFFFLTASIQLLNIAPYCWKCSKFVSIFWDFSLFHPAEQCHPVTCESNHTILHFSCCIHTPLSWSCNWFSSGLIIWCYVAKSANCFG